MAMAPVPNGCRENWVALDPLVNHHVSIRHLGVNPPGSDTPSWLVVSTPLKNMSSSVGMIIPKIWKNKK